MRLQRFNEHYGLAIAMERARELINFLENFIEDGGTNMDEVSIVYEMYKCLEDEKEVDSEKEMELIGEGLYPHGVELAVNKAKEVLEFLEDFLETDIADPFPVSKIHKMYDCYEEA